MGNLISVFPALRLLFLQGWNKIKLFLEIQHRMGQLSIYGEIGGQASDLRRH